MIRIAPWRALLVLAYGFTLFALASRAGLFARRLGIEDPWNDLIHIPVFAILAGLSLWSLAGLGRYCIAVAAMVCVGLALADEWYQAFIPFRGQEFADLLLDLVGIAIGLVLVAAARSFSERLDPPGQPEFSSGGESS